jgi:hypothetical protein
VEFDSIFLLKIIKENVGEVSDSWWQLFDRSGAASIGQ